MLVKCENEIWNMQNKHCYNWCSCGFTTTSSGLAPTSRPDSHSTSEALTPTTPTSSSQNRLGGAPSVNIISGFASGPGMDHMKAGGLAGLLGPPPKAPRGRKKIKAENPSGPLLVVPYPILADQGCVTVAPKEGKTYRLNTDTDIIIVVKSLLHHSESKICLMKLYGVTFTQITLF